jgi:hypothetical protein
VDEKCLVCLFSFIFLINNFNTLRFTKIIDTRKTRKKLKELKNRGIFSCLYPEAVLKGWAKTQ